MNSNLTMFKVEQLIRQNPQGNLKWQIMVANPIGHGIIIL